MPARVHAPFARFSPVLLDRLGIGLPALRERRAVPLSPEIQGAVEGKFQKAAKEDLDSLKALDPRASKPSRVPLTRLGEDRYGLASQFLALYGIRTQHHQYQLFDGVPFDPRMMSIQCRSHDRLRVPGTTWSTLQYCLQVGPLFEEMPQRQAVIHIPALMFFVSGVQFVQGNRFEQPGTIYTPVFYDPAHDDLSRDGRIRLAKRGEYPIALPEACVSIDTHNGDIRLTRTAATLTTIAQWIRANALPNEIREDYFSCYTALSRLDPRIRNLKNIQELMACLARMEYQNYSSSRSGLERVTAHKILEHEIKALERLRFKTPIQQAALQALRDIQEAYSPMERENTEEKAQVA